MVLFFRFETVFMPKTASEIRCLDLNPVNGFLTMKNCFYCKCIGLKMFTGSKGSILHFIVNRAPLRVGYIYAVMSKTPFA